MCFAVETPVSLRRRHRRPERRAAAHPSFSSPPARAPPARALFAPSPWPPPTRRNRNACTQVKLNALNGYLCEWERLPLPTEAPEPEPAPQPDSPAMPSLVFLRITLANTRSIYANAEQYPEGPPALARRSSQEQVDGPESHTVTPGL